MMQVNEHGTTQILPKNNQKKAWKEEIKYCPACYQNGEKNQLKLYQINMYEAVYLCPNYLNCLYPQANGWCFVKRSIDEMISDPESSEDDSANGTNIGDEVENLINKIQIEKVDSQIASIVHEKREDEKLSLIYNQMDNRLKYLDSKIAENVSDNNKLLKETEIVFHNDLMYEENPITTTDYLDDLDNFLNDNFTQTNEEANAAPPTTETTCTQTDVSNIPITKRIKVVSESAVQSNLPINIDTKSVSTQCFTVERNQTNQFTLKTLSIVDQGGDSLQIGKHANVSDNPATDVKPLDEKSTGEKPIKLLPEKGSIRNDLRTNSSAVLNFKGDVDTKSSDSTNSSKKKVKKSSAPPEWKSLPIEEIQMEDCSRIRVIKSPPKKSSLKTRSNQTVGIVSNNAMESTITINTESDKSTVYFLRNDDGQTIESILENKKCKMKNALFKRNL